MQTLITLGVAGATPFVLQFVMDFLTNGHSEDIGLRTKMLLSILTGGILAMLIALKQGTFPPEIIDEFFVILDGCISGAMATGGVALGFKVAEKISAGPSERPVIVTGTPVDEERP